MGDKMFDNHTYNIMMQLTEEHKSLWRIKKRYEEEADCKECQEFWIRLEKEKEEIIKELQNLLKKHICEK